MGCLIRVLCIPPSHILFSLLAGPVSFMWKLLHVARKSSVDSFRVRLHKLFNLPLNAPALRPAQSISFAPTKLLRSPHLQIKNFFSLTYVLKAVKYYCYSDKPRGVVATVKGDYNYHHYMQDGMDDSGWGCAYRSLQSIWSWFILNGFTDKPVPTHLDIQKCLVEIKDKEEKFIGSRQWIGSTEIGFVLDHMLGYESRYIITNSGSEVAERARELMMHFQTVGSPVMIGTILQSYRAAIVPFLCSVFIIFCICFS
ncbi:unnamed protein product [Cylicostephanus goldi]|uniref:UFSP1/2/DUB catalytic domain-containing protein n=1 Tax=Cylicostephanus goldi TaxID=71465 RepID=A0A3P6SMK9_CYLGO|nr:unnamed protein product [Cylicostephanus goldi]